MFELYPAPKSQLLFGDINILDLPCLDAALFLAEQSEDFGQAQGGSLYFNDLGIAVLQFENPDMRSFLFFNSPHNEPRKPLDADEIRAYYNEQRRLNS